MADKGNRRRMRPHRTNNSASVTRYSVGHTHNAAISQTNGTPMKRAVLSDDAARGIVNTTTKDATMIPTINHTNQ